MYAAMCSLCHLRGACAQDMHPGAVQLELQISFYEVSCRGADTRIGLGHLCRRSTPACLPACLPASLGCLRA